MTHADAVTVVGGGIAGLSLAWELVKRGRQVTVVEAERIGGAASAAATGYMEPRLGRGAARALEWEGLRRWPGFAGEVEAAAGAALGLRRGQLRYAFADTRDAVRADYERRREAGWGADWLEGASLREAYRDGTVPPGAILSKQIVAATLVREVAFVDGPAACGGLVRAIRHFGGTVREGETAFAGHLHSPVGGGTIVLANGIGAAAFRGLVPDLPDLEALKGTSLHYRLDDRPPLPAGLGEGHLVRGTMPDGRSATMAALFELMFDLPMMLKGRDLSVVPRPGALAIGASREPQAVSLEPDARIARMLHDRAVRVLPLLGIDFAGLDGEPRTGHRVFAKNTALALGRSQVLPHVWWSLGHGSLGYLRAPAIAAELAGAICGEPGALNFCKPFFRGPP